MSFFAKLKSGLSKTSGKLGGGITDIFTKKKLDDDSIESLEELLIEADLGVKMAGELCAKLAKQKFEKDISAQEVHEFLAGEIAATLAPYAVPIEIDRAKKPEVIVMVGVNGNGKTTTIGKLASQFKGQGLSVMLAAADTFRAAAVEQLMVWGQRSGIPVVSGAHESDPASVAFRAYEQARASGADVLLIDTAGRLQNKSNLMDELVKITKVLKKIDESAPHRIILVLDATTGGNALSQVQTFKEMVAINGLIVTKLDGTAKGGVVVALAKQCHLPIHAIGVGEGIADLSTFEPSDFARNLLDIN
ncbi:MAG: signal recognition particle-docking protein FtsY [Alphaproteobacteria bacterium]|nr:signal recognition particle-docking protein FtsY [Alphaproteobacteria bacterium]